MNTPETTSRPSTPTVPPPDAVGGKMDDVRNVRVLDAEDEIAFGFRQNGSITNTNFYDMLEISYVFNEEFQIVLRVGEARRVVSRNDEALQEGTYHLESLEGSRLNLIESDESLAERIMTPNVRSNRIDAFRSRVRRRDGVCVISGLVWDNEDGMRGTHQAVHIFPRNLQDEWDRGNYRRYTAGADEDVAGSEIDSVRNGMLLQATLHSAFDQFSFTVNPRDGYKIINFCRDRLHIDGRVLDPVCRNPHDPNRVSDELLLWHFRKAVMKQLRAAAGPRASDHDYDYDGDILGKIRDGPCAAHRMELELGVRLGAVKDWPAQGIEV